MAAALDDEIAPAPPLVPRVEVVSCPEW